MQKNKKRKGFTLTELAIVIAVIAILIAVLVPTFTSLITSANESADQQAVKSMNTALATDEAINGKPDSASEAVEVLEANGFNVENYQALQSGNTIYYDLTYNRCLIWSSTDSKVTYPSDMVNYYSKVDGIAANWYTFETIYNIKNQTKEVTDASSLTTALSAVSSASAGETVIVEFAEGITETLTISDTLTNSSGSYVTFDLNGNTLQMTSSSTSSLSNGSTLYIKDGTVENTSKNTLFAVESNSSITIENATINSDVADATGQQGMIYPKGNSAQVNVINSTIITTGPYGVATNAGEPKNYGVSINIENSTISTAACSGGYSCAVLLNVEGNLNIEDSTITGQLQGVFVRAGTATITNSYINTELTATQAASSSSGTPWINWTNGTANWSQGTCVAMGAVVVGNQSSSGYEANAVVTLTNCTLSSEITDDTNGTYDAYEISLYAIKGSGAYSTTVTVTGCTMNNYVINKDSTATLNYTGTVYTTWSTDTWTKQS